jgi:hypothetical protein
MLAAWIATIGSESRMLNSSAMAAMRQWSGSVIGPLQANFGCRDASNRPQYGPTPPSKVFQG